MRVTGLPVYIVGPVKFGPDGEIDLAHFFFDPGGLEVQSYVFDATGRIPTSSPDQVVYTRVWPDWYLVWEDAN
jgi:hypothetical protein